MNEISFPNYPRIGVGTIIRKEGKVLLGQRSAVGETGEGKWAFPGGRLEFYEDLIDCAKRETLEETWLSITNCQFIGFTNERHLQEQQHWITIFLVCDYESGTLENKEPDKCVAWNWYDWKELPSPLALGIGDLVEKGFHPFENIISVYTS